ncbi:hypothetical protein FB566_2422 [Stackebrandtia endophytica]|uniref:Lipoprotein n=2 Tax=Stackebrandtia endophytica TaxID=1496996 RepID=A0A543AWF4_9ACTN|nr:hypothetical protein FB566_2422 [Stackebrandtia endophytica]
MAAVAVVVSGCSGTAGDGVQPIPSLAPEPVNSAATDTGNPGVDLASRAALAKDQHYMAVYEWRADEADPVEVTVTHAEDGSWRVDVPGGAHGGKVDVTIVWTKLGFFQCELVKRDECFQLAGPDQQIPEANDPLVQHPFTDWLDTLLDRRNPLSIAFTDPPKGGDDESQCYSLERNSVSVEAPIPPSHICLRNDGTITWVTSSFGSLKLIGDVMPPPEQTILPGDVSDGAPLKTSPPPTKSPSPSPSDSPSPSVEP